MCRKPDMEFSIGGMWDQSDWSVLFDRDVRESCPHTRPNKKKKAFSDGDYICPRVVSIDNEGGFNGTGMCLDCIVEASPKITEEYNKRFR